MKKIVCVLAGLALAGAAFAEVTVGGWGRSAIDLFSKTGDADPAVVAQPGWAGGSRVGVNFAGSSDNIGFNLNVDSNAGTPGIGDQAKIWTKLGIAKFQFGKIQMDDLRGSMGDFGLFGDAAISEDALFARFNPSLGMTASIDTNGLFVGASFNANASLSDAYKAIQVGAGYTVANVGQFKAQYIGSATAKAEAIQVGAKITALDPIGIQVGVKILPEAEMKAGMIFAAAGCTYGAGALSGRTGVTYTSAEKTNIAFDTQINYNLEPCTVGITLYDAYAADKNTFSAMPYVKKGFSNGYLMAGFYFQNSDSTNTMALRTGAEYWF